MAVKFGTIGADFITNYQYSTVIYAKAGNDTISSYADYARIFGEEGDDLITSTSSPLSPRYGEYVFIDGGSGSDTIFADYFERGSFFGGDGNDRMTVYGGSSDIFGGAGNDDIWTQHARLIDGGDGDDNIYELETTSPTLIGGAGNDTLASGGSSGGYFYGGDGNDSIYGAQFAYGGDGNDTINGVVNGNYVDGGAGDDVLDGYAGEIAGGTGNDTITSNFSYFIDGGDGNDVIYGDAGLIYGGNGNDYITLGDYGAEVVGGAGADTIVGSGGAYYETFQGSGVYEVGSQDTLHYDGEKAGIRIDLRSPSAQFIASGNDKLIGIYNVTGTDFADDMAGNDGRNVFEGYNGNDRLRGFEGNDLLSGGAGDDVIDGGSGSDVMTGGIGNDTFFVSDAGDTVLEDMNAGTDTVKVTLASYTLGANVETLQFIGGGSFNGVGNSLANSLFGGAGDDRLAGLEGVDRLVGAAGNDTLIGGADRDDLTGGAGSDAFVFGQVDFGSLTKADVIKDFSHAQGDYIDLSLIPGLTFIGTGAFSRSAGEVRYEAKGPDTYVYGDVNGDGTADFAIQLSGSIALDASDLHL